MTKIPHHRQHPLPEVDVTKLPAASPRRKRTNPKLSYFKDEGGEWRFRIQAANGEIVMTSEGYTRRRDARRGFGDLEQAMRGLTSTA